MIWDIQTYFKQCVSLFNI